MLLLETHFTYANAFYRDVYVDACYFKMFFCGISYPAQYSQLVVKGINLLVELHNFHIKWVIFGNTSFPDSFFWLFSGDSIPICAFLGLFSADSIPICAFFCSFQATILICAFFWLFSGDSIPICAFFGSFQATLSWSVLFLALFRRLSRSVLFLALFRRLYPDLCFFQRATKFPCRQVMDACHCIETLRRRVEHSFLRSETVMHDTFGATYNVMPSRFSTFTLEIYDQMYAEFLLFIFLYQCVMATFCIVF